MIWWILSKKNCMFQFWCSFVCSLFILLFLILLGLFMLLFLFSFFFFAFRFYFSIYGLWWHGPINVMNNLKWGSRARVRAVTLLQNYCWPLCLSEFTMEYMGYQGRGVLSNNILWRYIYIYIYISLHISM